MDRKTIGVPGRHDLDLAPILPIVDSDIFQELRLRRQLGLGFYVFPGAHHTRFEHSLGVYSMSGERCARYEMDGVISKKMALNSRLQGLLHDIGHGPYSHATESLCPVGHNVRGLQLLEELRKEIEECGGDMAILRNLLQRKDPLSACVSHRPLGTDKLDYLWRDARHTTEAVAFRPGDMLNHVHFINGELVVDLKFVPEVMQVQLDYVNMHDRVYFRKGTTIMQYFLQQIVARAILVGGVDRNLLASWNDSRLDCALLNTNDHIVRELFSRVHRRRFPKAAVVLRLVGVKTIDCRHKDPEVVFPVERAQLDAFAECHQREKAAVHEAAIAEILGIPPESVLVTPVASVDRFVPDDVKVYSGNDCVGTLQEMRPRHYAALEEITKAYAAVRVCVPREYLEQAVEERIARRIFDYLMSTIK